MSRLERLLELSLVGNPAKHGWASLPQQLHLLILGHCEIQQLPTALSRLTQLRELSLYSNAICGGWAGLPQQLHKLTLSSCKLQQVPAGLPPALRELCLAENPIQGGWGRLPGALHKLTLSGCRLQTVPAELAGLQQLRELSLAGNRGIEGGWQALPRQLERLDVSACQLKQAPAALAGRSLHVQGGPPYYDWQRHTDQILERRAILAQRAALAAAPEQGAPESGARQHHTLRACRPLYSPLLPRAPLPPHPTNHRPRSCCMPVLSPLRKHHPQGHKPHPLPSVLTQPC